MGRISRMAHTAQDLAELLAGSRAGMVLTGAGISTESGIPDFRSAGGLCERYDPMQVASMTTFRREPELFWRFHRPRIDMLSNVEPNAAHLAVAELQRRGIVRTLVTQNIDRLHTRAGSPGVIEVHGSISAGECLGLPGVTALGHLLDELGAERRQVVGLAARHQPTVHADLLVHPAAAGASDVRPQAGPGGDGPVPHDVGLDGRPGAVADHR